AVDDLGNSGTGANGTASASVAVTVHNTDNDPPVITAPSAGVTTNEDTALAFTGGNAVSVNDPDASTSDVSVTLTVLHGKVAITVNPANDAPVLDNTKVHDLASIVEDVADAANGGTLVSALISGAVTDVDGGAVQGIAVTAADTAHGVWQFKLAGATGWSVL